MSADRPIVELFFEMLNTIKLFHWKTTHYATHKATDELHERLSEHTDRFVEVMIGKLPTDRTRIRYSQPTTPIFDLSSTEDLIHKLGEYVTILENFSQIFDSKRDSDLLNIRDEMLGNINQALYLLSLQ